MAEVDTLAHATLDAPSVEQCEEQIRRVAQSVTFRNSATLQLLLQFLTAKALAGSNEVLKEYTIGVEALGRKADFDPKIDPIVRVQSHRLRVKLKEYYDAEGSRDLILIQFAKGHYLPTFELMSSVRMRAEHSISQFDPASETAEEAAEGDGHDPHGHNHPAHAIQARKPRGWLTGIALALAAALFAASGYWLGEARQESRQKATAALPFTGTAATDERVVQNFWARFLGNDRSPVIAYTDAVFLLDDSNDLFRFRHGAIDGRGALVDPHLAREFASNPAIVAQAGQLYYENGYTGTGELESIAMLSGLLGRMGLKPTIKSSRDVGPDDLKQHNVILLGSPFQNAAVAQLLTAGDFSYQNPDEHHEQWRAQILDAHPRNGEAAAYRTEREPPSEVLKTDYSLITISPGVTPERSIAILGGLDTKGTEGATMFATSKFGVEQLDKALNSGGGGTASISFQALVRVHLAKGYQVLGADLVTVHPLAAKAGSVESSPSPTR